MSVAHAGRLTERRVLLNITWMILTSWLLYQAPLWVFIFYLFIFLCVCLLILEGRSVRLTVLLKAPGVIVMIIIVMIIILPMIIIIIQNNNNNTKYILSISLVNNL